MNRLARLIIPCIAFGIGATASAGPETGQHFLAAPGAVAMADAQEMSVDTAFSAETVDSLLAAPTAFQQSPLPLDSDLSTAEHPMIPLPSHALAAFAMLGVVACYALRAQRHVRLR